MSRAATHRIALVAATLVALAGVAEALDFAIIGDWGMGGWAAGSLAETRSIGSFQRACAEVNCNFTISVGDNIYTGNVDVGLRQSFEEGLAKGNDMTFFPSVGNHDNAGAQIGYSKRNVQWHFPSGSYKVEIPIDNSGYTVAIFAVNTMDGSLNGGGQRAWLENELKNSQQARWRLVFGHYPTTGSGRHRRMGSVGSMYALMEKYNAQVYFSGHDHILEVSNVGGRVLPISGAMSRGGMMWRGIGGAFRRWTLTNPSEYSKHVVDWPSHGFITAAMSPNVLTLSFWDHYGTMMYELSTTHDWLPNGVQKVSDAAAKNLWPPPDVVHAAYKAERDLPKGPGGGTVFLPGGKRVELPKTGGPPATDASGSTVAPTPAPPTTTSAPYTTQKGPAATVPQLTMAKELAKITDRPDDHQLNASCGAPPPWSFVQFAVAGECKACDEAHVAAGQPFTVFVSGYDVSPECTQLFISTSPLGCSLAADPNNAFMLPGTTRATRPSSNLFRFTSSAAQPTSKAYVCLSADHGATFRSLTRSDSPSKLFTVVQQEADGAQPPAPPSGPQPTAAGQQQQQQQQQQQIINAPPSPPSPPAPSSGGLSVTAVAIVGVVCVIAGAGVSVLMRQANFRTFERIANGESANAPAPAE